MKATLLVALIPCAILAACSNAESPGTASDTTTYDPNREAPAAARDDDFGNSITGESATTPATPSDAIRNGNAVPELPETTVEGTQSNQQGTPSDQQSDIQDDTGTGAADRPAGGTPAPQP